MLLQRLATGATGVKQARYRRGPTLGSESLYAHAQYNTQPVGMVAIDGPHMHGVMPAYEFRRGFCTLVLSFLFAITPTYTPQHFVRVLELWVLNDSVEIIMVADCSLHHC